uniref:Uncharacterized protein n=1 Tax=Sipha flava TaxID=143950 RepID=A0A2S2R7X5_9HEMI
MTRNDKRTYERLSSIVLRVRAVRTTVYAVRTNWTYYVRRSAGDSRWTREYCGVKFFFFFFLSRPKILLHRGGTRDAELKRENDSGLQIIIIANLNTMHIFTTYIYDDKKR